MCCRDLPLALTVGFLPFLFNQSFFFSLLLPFLQQAHGELETSCSRTSPPPVEELCQLPCHCRRYPPLPPPPPPPLPPRLLFLTVAPSAAPPVNAWERKMELLVLGTVSCASAVFLFLAVFICYKAIKRKPLRKEENGTSRGEYAMSSRSKQQIVETNNTGV